MGEHRAARQRERVDLAQVHDVEGIAELVVAELRRDVPHQPLADALDVVVNAVVVEHRHLLLDFSSRLAAELHVVRWRVFV